jgi:ribosomal-protein-alanine N-acetyltransferase
MDDAEPLFRIRSNPEVVKYINRHPDADVDATRGLISQVEENEAADRIRFWVLEEKESPGLIGVINFWQWKKEHFLAEMGYILAKECWNRGYMSEAIAAVLAIGFGEMGLHRVEADIDPNNIASQRVLERNGFVREAYFRENLFFDGRFYDSAIYALLKDDFLRRHSTDSP